MAGLFSAAFLLAGCAGTSSTTRQDPGVLETDQNQNVVVGQGTNDERNVITATNQKMFEAEHAESPAATAAPSDSPSPAPLAVPSATPSPTPPAGNSQ